MVNRISQDSNDLIRLPKPNGGELAESWRRKRSHTVIATADGQDAGVVAWSTTGMPGVAEVTIEYLGIAPDCRRRGIARHLILHALSHIQSMSRDQILDVSVMIDNSNSAAVQLYHRCGFRRTPVSFDVWLLEVGGT
jgi:ribosomal protein S18 acetylase RimI-like enzyme